LVTTSAWKELPTVADAGRLTITGGDRMTITGGDRVVTLNGLLVTD
jgi:hypothetical protein